MSVKYSVYNTTRGNVNVVKHNKKYLFYSQCSNKEECTPYKVTLSSGTYKFEAWGSAGNGFAPGKGAFVEGKIVLFEQKTLYFYIGTNTGFNSAIVRSKIHFQKAGGATDVRIVPGEWNDFESLKSRILVAGGGGSAEWQCSKGGDAGLNGTTGYGCYSTEGVLSQEIFCNGGTQTSGGFGAEKTLIYGYYRSSVNGSFGSSADGIVSNDFGGIGGGGYYGGASMDYSGAGGGGSSFISGHYGCDAIHESSSSKENIIHTHQSVHYSRLMFYNTIISNGTFVIPHFKKSFSGKGNTDVGAIRITIIQKKCTNKSTKYNNTFLIALFIVITLS